MKDSFGGSIMIYIIIFFLGIYIVFIALTLRYAQSFKLKNKTIDLIEQYNGDINGDFEDELTDYFQKNRGLKPTNLQIFIVKNNDLKNTCYYRVNTYIDWEWPFLGIEGTWDIHGETKKVGVCGEYSNNEVVLDLEL